MGVDRPTQERNALPRWPSGGLCLGLVGIFLGERGFAHTELSHTLTLLGLVLVLATLVYRVNVLMRISRPKRRIVWMGVLCHVTILLAIAMYYTTTTRGMELLSIVGQTATERWQTPMTVLWTIVLSCGLVPLLMLELSLGLGKRSYPSENLSQHATMELARAGQMARSGLSLSLALSFLMVTCNVAKERNIRRDVSYFKTSSPGSATVNMVKSMAEPLSVLLFFPPNNEVERQVRGYFESLKTQADNVSVKSLDRLLNTEVAKEFKVQKEGTIVLARGDQSEKLQVPVSLTDSRNIRRTDLRKLDSKIQSSLLRVLRATKTACLSVGHKELNDRGTDGTANPLQKVQELKAILRETNYKIDLYKGYGQSVSTDCDILFILAPKLPFLEEDLKAVDEFLAAGGSAIISLDPDGDFHLGLLEQRLGLSFVPAPVIDDRAFLPQTRSVASHALIITNQFSSHASVTTLSQQTEEAGILFVKSGSLDEVPLPDKSTIRRTHVVRSMASSFRDLPGEDGETPNFVFDKGFETRARYNLVTAVEDPHANTSTQSPNQDKHGMRAMVFADAEFFSDGLLTGRFANMRAVLTDAIKWAGRDEAYSGGTYSEEDKRIEHSKKEDALWFYATIVGAPVLVLGLGLLLIALRRRRRKQ